MNCVELVGRLVRDPDVRPKVTSFTLAVDRDKKEEGADFPRVVCFGDRAEMVAKSYKKGMLVEVQGKITTGSYEGKYGTVYTTDVRAEHVYVLEWNGKAKPTEAKPVEPKQERFAALDEDVPF